MFTKYNMKDIDKNYTELGEGWLGSAHKRKFLVL